MLKTLVALCLFVCAHSGQTRRSWDKPQESQVKSPRFINIYTNHDDFKEVLQHYTDLRSQNDGTLLQDEPVEPELEDTIDRRDDFNPEDNLESEFGDIVDLKPSDLMVINTNKYVVQKPPSFYENYYGGKNDLTNFNVDSIAYDDDDGNEPNKVPVTIHVDRRPKFKTQKYNFTEPSRHTRFSYVQKLPKPPTPTTTSTYSLEEINNETKVQINDMLRNYLNKLYMQKYNTTTKFYANSNVHKVPKNDDASNKSKFFDEAISGFKNKTMKIANKFFSLFQVVQFSNSKCTATGASGDYQGTCYHATDCSKLNGTAMGNCANGYGVCCVFRNTCGGSSNQNCTYFESPNYPNYYPSNGTDVVIPTTQPPPVTPDPRLKFYLNGRRLARQQDDTLSCIMSIYKQNPNITQMRIDFIDLELRSPTNGNCVMERLVITGQNLNDQIPVICGYNTGQHMYVDVSMLSGPLQLSVLSSMVSRKRWKIRICQFANTCTNFNCLQYFTGTSGVLTSFNYDQAAMFNRSSPQYMNNLNYAMCIRKEAGYCSITYTNVMNGVEYPFQFNNLDDNGTRTVPAGQAGADVINCPDDYIILDGSRLCGDKLNDGSVNDNFSQNAPVTDTSAGPIVIPVRTDSSVTGLGFKIFYMQNRCSTQ